MEGMLRAREGLEKTRDDLERIKKDLTRIAESRENKEFLVAASMVGEALQHFEHALMFVENAMTKEFEEKTIISHPKKVQQDGGSRRIQIDAKK